MIATRVIYSAPEDFADWFCERLAGVDCSPAYIAAWRDDFLCAVDCGDVRVVSVPASVERG